MKISLLHKNAYRLFLFTSIVLVLFSVTQCRTTREPQRDQISHGDMSKIMEDSKFSLSDTGSGTGTSGNGGCSGYTLCSADSECVGNPSGSYCMPCPACGKHCWNQPGTDTGTGTDPSTPPSCPFQDDPDGPEATCSAPTDTATSTTTGSSTSTGYSSTTNTSSSYSAFGLADGDPSATPGQALSCVMDLAPGKIGQVISCVKCSQGDASALSGCLGKLSLPTECLKLIVGAGGDLFKMAEDYTKFNPFEKANEACKEARKEHCDKPDSTIDDLKAANKVKCDAKFTWKYPYKNDPLEAAKWSQLCQDACNKGKWPKPLPMWAQ